jgi:hypothetical protein
MIHLRVLFCSLLWWVSVTSLALGADSQAKVIPLDADFQATVIHIIDGDTLTVLNEVKEQKRIRLNGIDCPEAGQAYGNKAKEFTKDLVAGKMVTVQAFEQDKYGRTINERTLPSLADSLSTWPLPSRPKLIERNENTICNRDILVH